MLIVSINNSTQVLFSDYICIFYLNVMSTTEKRKITENERLSYFFSHTFTVCVCFFLYIYTSISLAEKCGFTSIKLK